ncbi:MAG TPA: macro domain-containing protein [Vicinamibacterales bacterium]|nr:macro domain-containing protein [Vicinamibacterales bacterium]
MIPVPPGSLSLTIVEGDIAAQDVDAVVNAANNALWMGSGVAGALKARGGREIEEEAMRHGPIAVGEVVVTGGGRLPARHVIHAAVMGQDLRTDATFIEQATRNVMRAAATRGIRSLALPALGTGVGGFPLDECARVMMAAVRAEAPTCPALREVRFVLYGRRAYEIFRKVANERPS